MEFPEGPDLGTLLDREGVLPIETAAKYALQTCEALAAAHASNVVHRDIKPSNLFLTQGPDREPLIKVLDFGISKMLDGTTSGSITETQRAVGSPLAPAPLGGVFVSAPAARTGKTPEAGGSATATLRSQPPAVREASTPAAGGRSTDVTPPTVREGRPMGTTSRPDGTVSAPNL